MRLLKGFTLKPPPCQVFFAGETESPRAELRLVRSDRRRRCTNNQDWFQFSVYRGNRCSLAWTGLDRLQKNSGAHLPEILHRVADGGGGRVVIRGRRHVGA